MDERDLQIQELREEAERLRVLLAKAEEAISEAKRKMGIRDRSEVTVQDVRVFAEEGRIYIAWEGNIGFGEYALVQASEGEWEADSECMDRGNDKWFLHLLMEKFIEGVRIRS